MVRRVVPQRGTPYESLGLRLGFALAQRDFFNLSSRIKPTGRSDRLTFFPYSLFPLLYSINPCTTKPTASSKTLAPLHVGASAGEETGNLNLIFRDQFTQTGIIPGSSIRGALSG
jgi:hypothetical protein